MSIPRIVIVCQARVGSTRMHGKVLLPLAGAPLLQRFMERVSRSRYASEIIVATTMRREDGAIVKLCDEAGWNWYRGHTTDLLDRTYHAAIHCNADIVLKVPTDCPLIDPDIIDMVIWRFLERYPEVDYASNLHPASWPDGNDVEVMTIDALLKAYVTARAPHEREHTTPWLWDGNQSVRKVNVLCPDGVDYSMTHRWTIDYPEDYQLIRTVYDTLYEDNPEFGHHEILAFLEQHSDVVCHNRHLCGVNWYRHYMDVLRTINPSETRRWSDGRTTTEAA